MNSAPQFTARTRAEWRQWLQGNYATSTGVWLVTYKKSTGVGDLDYPASVEEALCFGWVDATAGKVDAERSKLWFTKRKPKSGWSKINKERIARLTEAQLMASAGLAAVALAKQNGSWNALDEVEALVIPPDLEEALHANRAARTFFLAFPPSAKKGILQWIQSAKGEATRADRIQRTVELAGKNLRANSWPKPG